LTVRQEGEELVRTLRAGDLVIIAVRCAVEVQRGMVDREPDVPEERRIRFRVGVSLGDVIVEEHDIFGDGVNVAARREALAEPGAICVSRMVRDQIRDKLSHSFKDERARRAPRARRRGDSRNRRAPHRPCISRQNRRCAR
jgi:adenylate cyclase